MKIIILLVISFLLCSCGSSEWKKKSFRSYEELAVAFKHASYSDVKDEFGTPSYKFLDLENQTVTYRWDGVGVKGRPDAYIDFTVLEYSTGFFRGHEFSAVSAMEGYRVPSNDDKYNIE